MIHDYLAVFAHGKESGPRGTKIQALSKIAESYGFHVESPDYQFTQDPDIRVDHLISLAPKANKKLVFIGSSMGGYVAANTCDTIMPDALFLMAPALFMEGYPRTPEKLPANTVIVHGKHDDIVLPDNAINLARIHQCDLHLIDSGHTLTDCIPFLEYIFSQLLQKMVR